MLNKRKIVFLTGTRADFGKLKSLIEITCTCDNFDVNIFATGMHMQKKYGYTVEEIDKCGYKNIYKFINSTSEGTMDQTLACTVSGFSNYLREINPDLIVIHGDRVEALAGAIAGSLNNILVAHVEGGEVSGTIDELIRHAVSKMSHIHFVANDIARKRLIQMGELSSNIFVIGSPDIDVMLSSNLPTIADVKEWYSINFTNYAIALFHPVTTEAADMHNHAKQFVDALLCTEQNYIVIYPNNDLGSSAILLEYERLKNKKNIRLYPSIRFEYFLVLLKNADFLIGNSSSGIREAPYYGLPAINIGSRQLNRALHEDVINCGYASEEIIRSIHLASTSSFAKTDMYGKGNSDELFLETISKEAFWNINKQKQFNDINYTNAEVKTHSTFGC